MLTIILISGCGRDETVNNPDVVIAKQGAYILSEGNLNAGSAALSFFDFYSGSFHANIYSPGTIGLYPDGLILDGNSLYLAEQGNYGAQGNLQVLDSNGLVYLNYSNLSGINPYSLAIADNKIFVTNGPTGSVSIIERGASGVSSSVTVGVFPQEILAIGSKVFVCNTSEFGGETDSSVSVIDAVAGQVIANIRVRQTPSALAVANDGMLLVGCPGNAVDGIIYKINPSNYAKLDSFFISNGFAATGFAKDIAVDKYTDDIYFISFTNNIVKMNLVTKTHYAFISNSDPGSYFYGYNFDSQNRIHYVADAKNFLVNGTINLFDGNGLVLNSYTTGIAPRRIVIKN